MCFLPGSFVLRHCSWQSVPLSCLTMSLVETRRHERVAVSHFIFPLAVLAPIPLEPYLTASLDSWPSSHLRENS